MAKLKLDQNASAADRDLYSGLIRLHVLHHAVKEPVFGLGMMEELARHGYRISGTVNRSGVCTEPRRSAGRLWKHRKARCWSSFMSSSNAAKFTVPVIPKARPG
jgi:hypothetical protein